MDFWIILVPFLLVLLALLVVLARRSASMGGEAEYDRRLLRGEASNGTPFPGHSGGGRTTNPQRRRR